MPESERYDIIEEINTTSDESAADIEVPPFQMDGFTPAETSEEAFLYAANILGIDSLDTLAIYHEIDLNIANAVNYAVGRIQEEFGDIVKTGYLKEIKVWDKQVDSFAAYSPTQKIVFLNQATTQSNALQQLAEEAVYEYQHGGWSTDSPYHSVYHELGHAVQHMICDSNSVLWDKITVLLEKTRYEVLGKNVKPDTKDENLKQLYGAKAKKAGISLYALFRESDLIAESIAQYLANYKLNSTIKQIIAWLKGG